jgi:hypothetical protein
MTIRALLIAAVLVLLQPARGSVAMVAWMFKNRRGLKPK